MKTLLALALAIILGGGASFGAKPAALPRVLIIGDSIYSQPAKDAAKELKERVEVVHVGATAEEVCNTEAALARLDAWLGKDKWDVIHFNFGLGDLVYRAPGMKSFRALPKNAGGIRATGPQQYEAHLRAIVPRLKATGAKLVWASTTPIRHSSTNIFDVGSEIEYNAIAARVMAAAGVPINDMHAFALPLLDMTKPAAHGVDPFFFDRKPLHPPIVAVVKSQLGLK
jgi:hypothetical protein